jgi:hypothetical protein
MINVEQVYLDYIDPSKTADERREMLNEYGRMIIHADNAYGAWADLRGGLSNSNLLPSCEDMMSNIICLIKKQKELLDKLVTDMKAFKPPRAKKRTKKEALEEEKEELVHKLRQLQVEVNKFAGDRHDNAITFIRDNLEKDIYGRSK